MCESDVINIKVPIQIHIMFCKFLMCQNPQRPELNGTPKHWHCFKAVYHSNRWRNCFSKDTQDNELE